MENDSVSNSTKAFLLFMLAVIAMVSYAGTLWILEIVNKPQEPDVQIPPVVIPFSSSSSSISSVSSSAKEISIVPLYHDFITSQNPFSSDDYQKVPRVIYQGIFKSASVSVKGTVVGNDDVFLIFNFGEETGVIDGIRTSEHKLNIVGTRKLGGIFAPASTFSTDVNLLGDTLGASSSNIGACDRGQCTFNFFGNTSHPQVAPILVVPVTLNGSFGGAEIDDVAIQYECNGDCRIEICPAGIPDYQCIDEKYGRDEAEYWYERYPNK